MSQPFGVVLVVLAGLVIIGVAVSQFVLAWRGPHEPEQRATDLQPRQWELVIAATRLGYAARGVSFGVIGLFLVIGGAQAKPEEARGLGGGLRFS
jgi:hypothetical protein